MEFQEANDRHLRSLHVEIYKRETAVAPKVFYLTLTQQRESATDTVENDTKKKKGNAKFTENGQRPLRNRFPSLGSKWTLKSGAVVRDVFFGAGEKLSVYQQTSKTRIREKLFDNCDWEEIKKGYTKNYSICTFDKTVYGDFCQDQKHG
ncbi:hypothetical protein BG011_009252 [Mortierella polycephala]|uniref:Uncharacterized protein n=1 Tax=Mortierella polycephala TaxID=41804 RepID=A0A9P6TWQ6_9FUNG|nr:hypothetical protein BG011_009252 [Mortierella polycephala]